MRREWWLLLGFVVLFGTLIVQRYRHDWWYTLRVLNAKRIADRFYTNYAALAKHLPYGPGPAQRLDAYWPESGAGHPVFVFVHGGSWYSGNKELYAPMAQRLITDGIAVVIPGYSLHPHATYRRQARDVAAAVAWTLENVDRFGGDPRRVVLGGHSAGAHLAALVTFDGQYLGELGHSPSEIRGLIGMSGVYDFGIQLAFERLRGGSGQLLIAVAEGQANFAQASPIRFVHPGAPPVLLIHGEKDETVPLRMATEFQAALQSGGALSRLLIYPKTGHSGLLLDAVGQSRPRLLADIARFVKEGEVLLL